MTYQTLIFADRWTCNCGSSDVPAQTVRGTWATVRAAALAHVATAPTPHTTREAGNR